MTDFVLWAVTLILGVVITIIATEPIQYLMAKTLGLWIHRPPRGIKGIWDSSYIYRSKGSKKTERQLIELRQFGNYVVGRVLSGQSHSHTFKGRIRHEIFFTGTWDTDVKGEIYHGAFQFVLDVQGKKMSGKWIGFDSQHRVDSGDWEWNLISDRIDSATKQRIVADFKTKGKDASSNSSSETSITQH
jgi:hypothetical protein